MTNTHNIQLASHDSCTGCAACESVCSHHAISMRVGDMGHLYPCIDANKCVECSRCTAACPAINKVDPNFILNAYAAWAKDPTEYETSVSGGAASVLSRYIIRHGGVVYGCAMLPDIVVKHIRVDNEDDLVQLKGSKYVQSDISEVFSQIKEDVKCNRQTLFIGTPCQVAAIKRMYKKQPDNLYLIDLICHGVPSIDALRKHIYRVAPSNEQYRYISFRSAQGFYLVVVEDELVEIYRKPLKHQVVGEDTYLGAFFRGYSYRESCYSCQFASSRRVGDITIGDFWGLGDEYPIDDMPEHPNGCSVMLPCTERGMKLINAIQKDIFCFQRPISEAINGNTQLRHPFPKTFKIKVFRLTQKIMDCPEIYHVINFDKFIGFWIGKIFKRLKKNIAI